MGLHKTPTLLVPCSLTSASKNCVIGARLWNITIVVLNAHTVLWCFCYRLKTDKDGQCMIIKVQIHNFSHHSPVDAYLPVAFHHLQKTLLEGFLNFVLSRPALSWSIYNLNWVFLWMAYLMLSLTKSEIFLSEPKGIFVCVFMRFSQCCLVQGLYIVDCQQIILCE